MSAIIPETQIVQMPENKAAPEAEIVLKVDAMPAEVLAEVVKTTTGAEDAGLQKDAGTAIEQKPAAAVVAAAVPEEEDDDHLTPLMMDNHTVVEHQDTFKVAAMPLISSRLADIADRVHEIPEFRPAAAGGHRTTYQLAANAADSDDSPQRSSHSGDESSSAKDSGCELASTADAADLATAASLRRGSNDSDALAELSDGESAPIEVPSDELAAAIVAQVQFYFSNENILKDAFLLKHVRRNKEGFVSLKLISSFKRVRQLTKDWRVVGLAVKRLAVEAAAVGVAESSDRVGIELNDVGSKVRRCEPLPVFDETMPSRTVVAADLPVERLTIESVSELFGKCGEIALIRVLRPGGTIPADVRQFYNKHPELHEHECALIEFTESMAARRAHELPGLHTYEMVAPKKKTGKKQPGGGQVAGVGGSNGSSNVTRIVESYRYPSYGDAERSRGGAELTGADYKYSLRRGSAGGYFVKYQQPDQQNCYHQHHQQRRTSFNAPAMGGVEAGDVCNSRRLSNCSIGSGNDLMVRKFSNCSESYYSSADISRRQSACSSQDSTASSFGRRASQCSSDYCPCSARRPAASHCLDAGYRRHQLLQQQQQQQQQLAGAICMEHGAGAGGHQRYMSSRRVSFDGEFNGERKLSGGVQFAGYERKLSSGGGGSGFEAMRKLSSGDRYYDSRKMSNDSGYDRRSSLGSLASEHRCSSGSSAGVPGAANAGSILQSAATTVAVAAAAKAEAFVRTPIGPDGSKGFVSRARKVGQVVGPV